MANPVYKLLQRAASRKGVTLRRHDAEGLPQDFMAVIRPVRTEHELIRLGGDGDGGYLVPNDLEGLAACFSPGVDRVATFERDLLDRGLRIFQIDASIDETPLIHERNDFERKFLGIETRDDLITLDDWVEAKMPDPAAGDLVLQMDIEGHEWLTLAQVSDETLARFRIIVLELHWLDRVVDSLGKAVIVPVLDRLKQHFDIVHLHANNVFPLADMGDYEIAPLVEATFLRKDRSSVRAPVASLPHPLDQDNVPTMASVAIPRSMYS